MSAIHVVKAERPNEDDVGSKVEGEALRQLTTVVKQMLAQRSLCL